MKYIQHRYKTKIELLPLMHTGYILRTRDFLGPDSLDTQVYLVNSFSFYQWRQLSLLKRSRILIEDFSQKQLRSLCFTQTPSGKTILHQFKRNQDSIRQLFSLVQEDEKDPFYVPVLEDNSGRNALECLFHHGISLGSTIQQNQFESVSAGVAFEILKQISDYPFDLFKINVRRITKQLIDADFVKFVQYMERRIRQPSVLAQVKVAKVASDQISIFTRDDIWNLNERAIRDEIEVRYEYDLKRVEICVLDMYLLHLSKNEQLQRYNINIIYDKLAETDSLQVFNYNSVKALIEIKWKYIMKRIIMFQLVPYVFFMIIFIVYTTYDYEYYDTIVTEGK